METISLNSIPNERSPGESLDRRMSCIAETSEQAEVIGKRIRVYLDDIRGTDSREDLGQGSRSRLVVVTVGIITMQN